MKAVIKNNPLYKAEGLEAVQAARYVSHSSCSATPFDAAHASFA